MTTSTDQGLYARDQVGALTDEEHSLLYVQFLVNSSPAPQYREPRWLSPLRPRC